MSLLAFRLLMTLLSVAVVGWMVWDQTRLRQMTPTKWAIATVLLGTLVGSAWL